MDTTTGDGRMLLSVCGDDVMIAGSNEGLNTCCENGCGHFQVNNLRRPTGYTGCEIIQSHDGKTVKAVQEVCIDRLIKRFHIDSNNMCPASASVMLRSRESQIRGYRRTEPPSDGFSEMADQHVPPRHH